MPYGIPAGLRCSRVSPLSQPDLDNWPHCLGPAASPNGGAGTGAGGSGGGAAGSALLEEVSALSEFTPSFMWLLRDFYYDLEGEHGVKVGRREGYVYEWEREEWFSIRPRWGHEVGVWEGTVVVVVVVCVCVGGGGFLLAPGTRRGGLCRSQPKARATGGVVKVHGLRRPTASPACNLLTPATANLGGGLRGVTPVLRSATRGRVQLSDMPGAGQGFGYSS